VLASLAEHDDERRRSDGQRAAKQTCKNKLAEFQLESPEKRKPVWQIRGGDGRSVQKY
jgi:hypothetical protein